MIKDYLFKYKIQIIRLLLIILLIVGSYIIASNNYGFYNTPIGSIIDESSEFVKTEKSKNGEEEKYYSQNLTLRLRNSDLKGNEIQLTNEYRLSQIDTTKYKKGDDLFLNIEEVEGQVITVTIANVKRDKYAILLISIFILVMIMISGKRGLLTLLTLTVNIFIFVIMIQAYVNRWDFKYMISLITVVFSTITLLILGGVRKKSISSVISTIATICTIMIIYQIVYRVSEDLPYEMMNYISGPDYLEVIFRASILLGGLGAIMDIAITINSSVHELVETTPTITKKELYGSVKEIGYDIMGTMINVLFFTYFSACIPMILLKIANGYAMINILRYGIIFDTIRFLMGAIGIVLAIPISSFVAISFIGNRLVKENAR